jgi:hypothetical protein
MSGFQVSVRPVQNALILPGGGECCDDNGLTTTRRFYFQVANVNMGSTTAPTTVVGTQGGNVNTVPVNALGVVGGYWVGNSLVGGSTNAQTSVELLLAGDGSSNPLSIVGGNGAAGAGDPVAVTPATLASGQIIAVGPGPNPGTGGVYSGLGAWSQPQALPALGTNTTYSLTLQMYGSSATAGLTTDNYTSGVICLDLVFLLPKPQLSDVCYGALQNA